MHTLTARSAVAARELRTWPGARRRDLLHAIAESLADAGSDIVAAARDETGLAEARLRGELTRTTNQLRLLGDHVAMPRPAITSAPGGVDITVARVPVGPVAVFAASNFPLAFGVAGGDTAAALAAGCPVVVKAHPAQPVTSALIAGLVRAVTPADVFAMVRGGPEVSIRLVTEPAIRAVAFTGSPAGGRALLDAAAARPDPIPVYAEMGSLNPVFVLPGAAAEPAWAKALADAVTGSSGQLCTKPGLVVVPDTADGAALAERLAKAVAAAPTHRMLTPAMANAHALWLERAASLGEVTAGEGSPRPFAVQVTTLGDDVLAEHFGPAVVICRHPVQDYPSLLESLAGSLTATVLAAEADHAAAADLLPALAATAGRVVWNGVPTGVAVCDAMVHGGPWPATSAPWSTSVGTAAVERFLRPVALQGVPSDLAAVLGGN